MSTDNLSDDVDLQQQVEALQQYMDVVQQILVSICERLDKLEGINRE